MHTQNAGFMTTIRAVKKFCVHFMFYLVYVAGVLKLSRYQNDLEVLLKHRLLGPTSRISYSVALARGLRICISNRFPGHAATASLRTIDTT